MAPPPPLSTSGRLTRTKKIKQKKRGYMFSKHGKKKQLSDRLRLIDLKKYITKNNHIINNNINENSNNKKNKQVFIIIIPVITTLTVTIAIIIILIIIAIIRVIKIL